MRELPFDLASIDLPVLEEFQADRDTRERHNLELKRGIQFQADGEKLETLADLSSFANATGGDVLFGVAEGSEPGRMGEIVGIERPYDAIVRQVEETMNAHINPRIPGVRFHRVPIVGDKYVLVARIPKSQIAPHMVTFQNTFKIWGRGAAGKVLLSTQQIRDLVTSTDSLEERVRKYRSSRAAAIISQDIPVSFEPPPYALFHLLPIDSFAGHAEYSIADLLRVSTKFSVPGKYAGTWGPVFDGIVRSSQSEDADGYSQLSREAVAEGLCTQFAYEADP